MRLFVEIAEGHRISKQLIKLLGHLQAHRLFQLKIKRVSDCSELLKFTAALVNSRLCTRTISRRDILCHIFICLLLLALDVGFANLAQESFRTSMKGR